LRCPFGPQPPSADAGEAIIDAAAETMTTPSSAAESFFITTSKSDAIKKWRLIESNYAIAKYRHAHTTV
jgi:hypothetical protein